MKTKHYICPRGCGKTTFAEELQMKDPEGTLLFSNCSTDILGKNFRGQRFNKVIFDGFLDLYGKFNEVDKVRFTDWFICHVLSVLDSEGELILISTPDMLRNSSSYLLLSNGLINKSQIQNEVVNKDTIIKEIYEFQRLFLTPNVENLEIIQTNFNKPKMLKWEEEEKKQLPHEKYLTDIKGEFLR